MVCRTPTLTRREIRGLMVPPHPTPPSPQLCSPTINCWGVPSPWRSNLSLTCALYCTLSGVDRVSKHLVSEQPSFFLLNLDIFVDKTLYLSCSPCVTKGFRLIQRFSTVMVKREIILFLCLHLVWKYYLLLCARNVWCECSILFRLISLATVAILIRVPKENGPAV